ncbi:MAG: MATE family efflux transporter [Agathobacter sp.]|nr:MATE family efflux transporter [Agathobacter sp.]
MNDSKRYMNELTEGPIGKQLLLFFFPILFGTFFQQLYNTIDAIVVGRFVGSDALAAVGGSSGMIANLIVGFFVGLTAGASVIVSQFFGSGDRTKVNNSIHTIYGFSIIGSVIISIIGYLSAPALLEILNTPADIFDDSLIYLRVFLSGIIFIFIYNTGSSLLRALGDSKRPLIYLIICCLVNIVLDILLVVIFKLGVLGVAIATLIAQAISAVLVTSALLSTKELCDFSLKEICIDWDTLKTQLYIGFPGGVQTSMYSLSNMILQSAVNSIGTDAAAAWTALGKLDGIYWMIGGSLGTAITTFVGQNYGAGLMHRVKKSVNIGLGLYFIFAIVIVTILMAFQYPLFSIFTDNTTVLDIACTTFSIMAPFYITFGFIEIYSCALRGMGDAIIPMIMTMLGICGFRVFWIIFVFPLAPSMETISWNYPISWIVTSVFFIFYYRHKIK